MTFVGKILVIIITLFAVMFVALTAVVFNTETNWREKTKSQSAQIKDLQTKLTQTEAAVSSAVKERDNAAKNSQNELAVLSARIKDLNTEKETAQKEITDNRVLLEAAQNNAKNALAEAADRTKETDALNVIVRSTQKQANEFKDQQRELKDQIRTLERQLDVAVKNNSNLRERVKAYVAVLKNHNISDDVSQVSGRQAPPPDVVGEVLKVDSRNRRVEISIGSDDGLVVGHELFIFHDKPTPEYIGRFRIDSVDPDHAVGTVVGKTINGKKIVEGDSVTTKIRPRS